MNFGYDNKKIAYVASTEFLRIVIKNPLFWELHIQQIISKLSAACCAIRYVKPYISHETLKVFNNMLSHTKNLANNTEQF